MFNTYEFIYNEIPSSMYGLFICDFDGTTNGNVSFGNKADIIERKVNGRVSPLHFGVDYNKEPLSFKLIFASYKELDRWDMQEIARWLTGYSDYKWLYIEQCDMENLGYRCLITELTPLHVGWAPYAFEATVRCDCPYAYGPEFENVCIFEGIGNFVIFNDGTARERCFPIFEIENSGWGGVGIKNDSTNEFFELQFPVGVHSVYVDNGRKIITDTIGNIDLYPYFNDEFISLVPGENNLFLTGGGSLTVKGRYYFNVGA